MRNKRRSESRKGSKGSMEKKEKRRKHREPYKGKRETKRLDEN